MKVLYRSAGLPVAIRQQFAFAFLQADFSFIRQRINSVLCV